MLDALEERRKPGARKQYSWGGVNQSGIHQEGVSVRPEDLCVHDYCTTVHDARCSLLSYRYFSHHGLCCCAVVMTRENPLPPAI